MITALHSFLEHRDGLKNMSFSTARPAYLPHHQDHTPNSRGRIALERFELGIKLWDCREYPDEWDQVLQKTGPTGSCHHTADNTSLPFPTRAAQEFLTSKIRTRQKHSQSREKQSALERRGGSHIPKPAARGRVRAGALGCHSSCRTLWVFAVYRLHVPHHAIKVRNFVKPSLNNLRKPLGQTLILTGDYNCPDTCWKGNMAGHKQLRRFLEGVRDNLLIQVQDEPTRYDAQLDLLFTSKGRTGWARDNQWQHWLS